MEGYHVEAELAVAAVVMLTCIVEKVLAYEPDTTYGPKITCPREASAQMFARGLLASAVTAL